MTDLVVADERNDELRIEKWIWRNVGRQSVREMAAELGVSPEAVLKVKRDMVDSVDPITEQVLRAKLLRQMHDLADTAQERASDAEERNVAGLINASAGAIKNLFVEYNRAAKQNDSAVQALNEMRVREILRLIDTAVAKTLGDISEQYDLDNDVLQGIFQGYLRESAEEMDD